MIYLLLQPYHSHLRHFSSGLTLVLLCSSGQARPDGTVRSLSLGATWPEATVGTTQFCTAPKHLQILEVTDILLLYFPWINLKDIADLCLFKWSHVEGEFNSVLHRCNTLKWHKVLQSIIKKLPNSSKFS